MIVISTADKFGHILNGRVMGRSNFAEVCSLLAAEPPGGQFILDFQKVDYVTGSWLNAMLVPLVHWAGEGGVDLFPLLTNISDAWLDDLGLVAEWNHQCYLIGSGKSGQIDRSRLIGQLDPAQAHCLKAVIRLGGATGAKLEREYPKEGIRATAWNNRLRDLYGKRLLRSETRGRERVYRPITKEIICNG